MLFFTELIPAAIWSARANERHSSSRCYLMFTQLVKNLSTFMETEDSLQSTVARALMMMMITTTKTLM
jgi:hypothetical protein